MVLVKLSLSRRTPGNGGLNSSHLSGSTQMIISYPYSIINNKAVLRRGAGLT